MRKKRVVLKHDADLAPIRGNVGDALPFDGDLTAFRNQKSGDKVEQRGLPAAGRTEQRHQLAAAHKQRYGVEGGDLAESLGHARELDGGMLAAVRAARYAGRSGKRGLSGNAQR